MAKGEGSDSSPFGKGGSEGDFPHSSFFISFLLAMTGGREKPAYQRGNPYSIAQSDKDVEFGSFFERL
ncbi:MAG: hypothetical protein EOM19_03235 [Candidatus Moranbacteria bacterium]|nr:hypothetical protein [Candidatus Moranbacteria bacterium]